MMVLEPTRFPLAPDSSWLTVETVDGEVHVVPAYGDAIARDHRLALTCFCNPHVHRDGGPLSDPVFCHNEPTWPGADLELHRPAG